MKIRLFTFLAIVMLLVTACGNDDTSSDESKESTDNQNSTEDNADEKGYDEDDLTSLIPSLDEYDEDEQELIKKGEELNDNTNEALPDNVGNNLSCISCHASPDDGDALTLVGVSKKFPQHSPREGREVTLEERINGCFTRSMGGELLDPDGEEMEAFVAYYDYISANIDEDDDYDFMTVDATGSDIPEPNVKDGEAELEKNNCMTCHGASGPEAAQTGPALWGDDSFNDGAGMARFSKMQYYVKNFMPKGNPNLTEQEASNISAYILLQDRPEFEGENEFPDGGPGDYIDKETREALLDNTMEWTEFKQVKDSE